MAYIPTEEQKRIAAAALGKNTGVVNMPNLAAAVASDPNQRLQLLDSYGPTGKVTAKYGNEAGATFNVDPGNTAGLRAGAIVQDGAGKQWIVGDDYKWAPYTGEEQWQTISAADDARQKLVQDWYNTGMDPANAQAIAAAAYLGQNGRLGAVQPRAGGPITRDNIGELKAGLDASMQGGVAAAGSQSASTTQRGVKSSGGATVDAGPGDKPSSSGSYTGGTTGSFSYGPAPTFDGSQYYNRRDQLLDNLEGMQFNYDLATDPVWQSYQKTYLREGKRATEDALGRASALTGGVPSSYAVGAATQAGNYYASQLADKIPQLYNDAYNRYLKEYERQLGLADTYNQYGQQEYREYQDKLNQFNKDRDFDYGVYGDDYDRAVAADNTAYNRARQTIQDRLDLAQTGAGLGDYSWYQGLGFNTSAVDGTQAAQGGQYTQAQVDAAVDSLFANEVVTPEFADVLGFPAGTPLDQIAAQLGIDLGQSTGGAQGGAGGVPTDYAYASDGTTYTIGSGPAWDFILKAQPGETMTGGDGSTWTMSNDGNSVTISKGGKTYTYSFGQPEAPAAQNANPAPAPATNPPKAPKAGGKDDTTSETPVETGSESGGQEPMGITNRNGNGWIEIPGHGRFTKDELQRLMSAGNVLRIVRDGKVTYTWNNGTVGSGSGVMSLDYDEDEGIFRWNGESYGSLSKLASAIDAASLTDSQKKALAKKFKTYGFNVSFD